MRMLSITSPAIQQAVDNCPATNGTATGSSTVGDILLSAAVWPEGKSATQQQDDSVATSSRLARVKEASDDQATSTSGSPFTQMLDAPLTLPLGYATTRRSALRVASLGGALASLYVILSRAKVWLCAGHHS